jgi:hypothetical protein
MFFSAARDHFVKLDQFLTKIFNFEKNSWPWRTLYTWPETKSCSFTYKVHFFYQIAQFHDLGDYCNLVTRAFHKPWERTRSRLLNTDDFNRRITTQGRSNRGGWGGCSPPNNLLIIILFQNQPDLYHLICDKLQRMKILPILQIRFTRRNSSWISARVFSRNSYKICTFLMN